MECYLANQKRNKIKRENAKDFEGPEEINKRIEKGRKKIVNESSRLPSNKTFL